MADLAKVQQAIQGANVTGVRGLVARQNGNVIEIHGQADSIAAKQSAIKAITSKAGDTGLANMIQVATSAQTQANPTAAGAQVNLGPQAGATSAGARTHTVKKGETLSTIARRSGVSVKQLAAANGISSSHRVRTGERLKIPD